MAKPRPQHPAAEAITALLDGEGRLAAGGAERSNVFTRIQLALYGAGPWNTIPTMPVEMSRDGHRFARLSRSWPLPWL